MKLRCSVTQFVGVEEGQVASCESTMHGVFISVWPVRCRLCRLHVPTWCDIYTNESRNTKDRQSGGNHLRKQQDVEPEDIAQNFRNLKTCQNKFDCLILKCFFYKRTETNAKQIVRFNSRQIICLEQFLLRLFYSFLLYIFSTFLHILSHFSVRHIFIDFNLF